MNFIIYSPLEQFEFMTIGISPNYKLSVYYWLFIIDHCNFFQENYGLRYNENLKNIASVVVEGFCNISFLEFLEAAKNYLDIYYIADLYDLKVFNIEDLPESKTLHHRHYTRFTMLWLNVYNSIAIVLILFMLVFIYFNITKKNNIWTYVIDLFFSFLLQTFLSLADRRLLNYFPIFCTFFFVIFFSNLTALVPLSFCLTSNLWLTLTLSLSVWVSVTVLAIVVRGFGFFTGFVPANVPAALKGFITVIEIISYLARAISLGVRIFANMLAGHSLVHILSDLVETCIVSFNHVSLKVFGIFPALILTFILFIEFGICFLQALVFVILTAIYLKEAFGFAAH